ncbi:MAG: hypothetical protein QM804_01140 [Propionicimonas sp.]
METGVWGIVAVLVIGTAVVCYGWWSDRTDDRRRAEALRNPPEREIPRFRADEVRPRYLSELEAVTRPADLPPTDLTEADRAKLRQLVAGAAGFPAGWPSPRFVTDTSTGWCVIEQPAVLICQDELTAMRELLPAVKRTREAGRPLVVVAPGFSDEVLATLRANWVQGSFAGLPLQLEDADRRRSLASLTGASPVAASDLQAGYLPADNLGSCQAWVCDQRTSWVLLEGLK